MTRKESKKSTLVGSKKRVHLTVGDSVRIAREMLELSQTELSELCGIAQSTLSGIEKNKLTLGVERAKVLAKALRVHPAVLLFPDWDLGDSAA